MDEEPPTEPSDFTVREKIIATIIGLPLTYGLALLCGHLEGVDKSGWVWWPSLIGLVFSGGLTIGCFCSLVWNLLLSTGIISRVGLVIEWIIKIIVYIVIVWFGGSLVSSVGSEILDAFDDLNKRELLFFVLGGFVVYVYLNRDQ